MRNSLVFVFFLVSCQLFGNRDSLKSSQETNKYLEKIAIYNQSKTDFIKWKKDVKIFIHPINQQSTEKTDALFYSDFIELKNELSFIVQELNELINPISISFVSVKEESNLEILIGSENDSRKLDASTRFLIHKNWAVQHCSVTGDGSEILNSFIFLDLYRTPNLRIKKRLLRKKIVQSLGLFKELDENKESIFYGGFSEQIQFSTSDLDIIRLLYNSNYSKF
jgi:hypothetical protein